MSTPNLPAVIEARVRAALACMRVMEPARVVEYDHVTQKCSAQPLIMSRRRNADGDIVAEPRAVIGSIPVEFPGSGPFSITWNVKPGDIVMLVYASSSLTKWLLHGGEVDPADGRRQNINDAVAIPGLRSFNLNAPDGAAPISAEDDGGVTSDDAMVIAAPEIRLGSAAADHDVAWREDLEALKDAIAGAVTVANDGGASFKADILSSLAGWPSPAGRVKVE